MLFLTKNAEVRKKIFPRLLEKAWEAKNRVLVYASTCDLVKQYNDLLWTYSKEAFLPHGSDIDDYPELQPIYLTSKIDNINKANLLFIVDGVIPGNFYQFERILDIFEYNNDSSLKSARKRYNHYQREGGKVSCWSQNTSGKWQMADMESF
jgi:DNA polymerase-3 subunit chi